MSRHGRAGSGRLAAVALLALLCGHADAGADAPRQTLSPSPEGRTYQVAIVFPALGPDCWEFAAGGDFDSGVFGAGSWELQASTASVARWSGGGGGGLVFFRFAGFTYGAGGRRIFAVGFDFIDPFGFPFIAVGLENPLCLFPGAEPSE